MSIRVNHEQLQTLTYLNAARKAAHNIAPTSAQIIDLLHSTALAIIGDDALTDQFVNALDLDTDRAVADVLDDVLGIPRCYVALVDLPGQDTKAVYVFADFNEAYDWIQEYDDEGTPEVQTAEYVPATILELPDGLDLDLIAYDIADAMNHYERGLSDVGQDDYRAALPAFLAAAIDHAKKNPA
jgi:hypothetical protein